MREMMLFFSGAPGIVCLVLLVAGLALLITEMCIPGFGAPGFIGSACLLGAIALQFFGNTLRGALTFTACVAVLVLLLLLLFLRSFKNGALSRSPFVNRAAVKEAPAEEENGSSVPAVCGMKGKTLTPLRPAGIVELEGRRVNAKTDGAYLEAGTAVEVIEVKGLGIIVHEIL